MIFGTGYLSYAVYDTKAWDLEMDIHVFFLVCGDSLSVQTLARFFPLVLV